jgi:hypothetical protein
MSEAKDLMKNWQIDPNRMAVHLAGNFTARLSTHEHNQYVEYMEDSPIWLEYLDNCSRAEFLLAASMGCNDAKHEEEYVRLKREQHRLIRNLFGLSIEGMV